MSGDHDRRQGDTVGLEPSQQLEPVHSRQHRIDHQTAMAPRAQRRQERFAAFESLHVPSMRFEHLSDGVTHAGVVVDNEDRPRR